MTGKEALEKIKNNQHYREEKNWIIATSLQNTEEYKAIVKRLEDLKEELGYSQKNENKN